MTGSAKVIANNNDDVPEMPPLNVNSINMNQSTTDRLVTMTQPLLQGMWLELLDKKGTSSYEIISGSMSPVIETNDVVRISRVDPSRICIGDIVAFRCGRNIMVHRVIWKRWSGQKLYFRQMGDACRYSGRFPAENLIGKVTLVQKRAHEIDLDSPSQVIKNRVKGWRLLMCDYLNRKLRRPSSRSPWKIIRLIRGL